MKKILLFIFTILLIVSFASCKEKDNGKDESNQNQSSNVNNNEGNTSNNQNTNKTVELDPIDFSLPSSSTTFDKIFAKFALKIATGHEKDTTNSLFKAASFEILSQKNFDKNILDAKHNSAFTIGYNEAKNVVLVSIRGTVGAEWYSNFNFAFDTYNNETETIYAENYLKCATEIYNDLLNCVSTLSDYKLIITGHSRGAACANLLGVLVDQNNLFDKEDVFVYTFATPTTIRNQSDLVGSVSDYNNIFNVINPYDMVTYVPPVFLGFERAGVDLIATNMDLYIEPFVGTYEVSFLESYESIYATEQSDLLSIANTLAPTIKDYYSTKHVLYNNGKTDVKATPYQFMQYLITCLDGYSFNYEETMLDEVPSTSDFYPLVQKIKTLSTGDKTFLKIMLTQHLVDAYNKAIDSILTE